MPVHQNPMAKLLQTRPIEGLGLEEHGTLFDRGSPYGRITAAKGVSFWDDENAQEWINRTGRKDGWFLKGTSQTFESFGGVGDGITDNSEVLQLALDTISMAGGGTLTVGPGTFRLLRKIIYPNNVNLVGSGMGITILDFTGFAATVTNPCIVSAGSLTLLPGLSGLVALGASTIGFASPHGLAVKDLIAILDTVTAFNTARGYYKQGEMMRVSAISSSTDIVVGSQTYAAYGSGATTKLWKLNTVQISISNMSMRFPSGGNAVGIKVSMGSGCVFEKLDLSGAQHSHIFLDRCYECWVNKVRCFDNQATAGDSYGPVCVNCQRITITDCNEDVNRHGISFGAGATGVSTPIDAGIVNREITIKGGVHNSNGALVPGINFHGNSEHYSIIGTTCPCGIEYGGDNVLVQGNIVGNSNASGYCIDSGEMVGMNITITGNKCYARNNLLNNGMIALIPRTDCTRRSVCSVFGNQLYIGAFRGSTQTLGISATLVAPVGTRDITFVIKNNDIMCDTQGTVQAVYGVRVLIPVTEGLNRLVVEGNYLNGCGLQLYPAVEFARVLRNTIDNAINQGITVVAAASSVFPYHLWRFEGNVVHKSNRCGMELNNLTAGTIDWHVRRNVSINNAQSPAGSPSADSSLFINGGNEAVVVDNTFGDNNSPVHQQRNFTILATTLYDDRNFIVGNLPSVATVTNRISKEQIEAINSAANISWGDPVVSALTTFPYTYRRDVNGLAQFRFRNKIALGNTLAGAAIILESQDSLGGFEIFPSDYADPNLAKFLRLEAASNCIGGSLDAISSGQYWKFRCGSAAEVGRFALSGLEFQALGKGLSFKSGANGRVGQAVLSSGTVVVNNTSVTASTHIILQRKTGSGTLGMLTYALNPGMSFTINSSDAGDNSTVDWLLIELV